MCTRQQAAVLQERQQQQLLRYLRSGHTTWMIGDKSTTGAGWGDHRAMISSHNGKIAMRGRAVPGGENTCSPRPPQSLLRHATKPHPSHPTTACFGPNPTRPLHVGNVSTLDTADTDAFASKCHLLAAFTPPSEPGSSSLVGSRARDAALLTWSAHPGYHPPAPPPGPAATGRNDNQSVRWCLSW